MLLRIKPQLLSAWTTGGSQGQLRGPCCMALPTRLLLLPSLLPLVMESPRTVNMGPTVDSYLPLFLRSSFPCKIGVDLLPPCAVAITLSWPTHFCGTHLRVADELRVGPNASLCRWHTVSPSVNQEGLILLDCVRVLQVCDVPIELVQGVWSCGICSTCACSLATSSSSFGGLVWHGSFGNRVWKLHLKLVFSACPPIL